MNQKIDLKPGQQLFVAPIEPRNRPHWKTILKVGQLWVSFVDGYRMDIETWEMEGTLGYAVAGHVFLTEEAYQVERSRRQSYERLQASIRKVYRVPKDLSEADILQAAAILGIDMSNENPS